MGTLKKVYSAFICLGVIGTTLFAGVSDLKKDPRDRGRYRGDVRKEKRFRIMGRSAQVPSLTGIQSGMGRLSAVLPNPPMFNYPVYDIEVYDGKAYVIGGFSAVSQERMGYGIPVDKVTGLPISGYDPINGKVENVVEDGKGGWFINGNFTRVGTTDRAGFAHILPNGKLDPNWNLLVNFDYLRKMAYFNGKLYVAVVYYLSDDSAKVEIRRYNTTGGQLEKNWTLYEGDWDNYPDFTCMKVAEGRIYLAGNFASLDRERPRPYWCGNEKSVSSG